MTGQMDEAKTVHVELSVSTHFYILSLDIHKYFTLCISLYESMKDIILHR